MKKFFKCLWPFLLSYGLGISIIALMMLLNNPFLNYNAFITSEEALVMFTPVVFIFGIYFSLKYFMDKAYIEEINLKNVRFNVALIWILNIFYVPYFNMRYIEKIKKYKLKTILYYLTIIPIYVLAVLSIITWFKIDHYQSYDSIYGYKLRYLLKYEMKEDKYSTIFESNEGSFSILVAKDELTPEEIIDILTKEKEESNDSCTELKSDTITLEDKTITYKKLKTISEGDTLIEVISTVQFEGKKDLLINLNYAAFEEDYNDEELLKIYLNLNLEG